MNKAILLTLLACTCYCHAFSQASIRGKLFDSSLKKPLGLATVTVFKAADTVLITYRLSTPEGEFRVPGLPVNTECRVLISYSGYGVYRKEFKTSATELITDLGTIYMSPDSRSLDEVLVISERPPVSMRKDTIEFNAGAFKTLPNALVEDLLKKLPGVQVDADGNITVNGKPVNRILVDGKSFFGDDPKMATKNLPANVIDKVQVMDDKEELLRNGDNNLNNVGKVVNITLKKGVKKGMFGKLYAGAGTKELYEIGGIANIYRDTFQISVLGYMNNLNKPGFGFTDLMQAGGFQRSRGLASSNSTSTWTNPGGSGISINGINFGGAQNYGGIATSKGGGFNLNHSPNAKRSIFLQYFNGNIFVDRHNNTDINQYNSDTVINSNTDLTGGVVTHAHNIGLGARLKPDSLTNILININYTIGLQDEDRFSDVKSVNNKLGQLSYGEVDQNNLANTYYYRHAFNITRLSAKKKGRRISFTQNTDINNRFNDYTTESAIRYVQPAVYDSVLDQLRAEKILRTDINTNVVYNEPLNKTLSLRLTGLYYYGKLNNPISTFNPDGTGKYDLLNAPLSSTVTRDATRATATTALDIKVKDLTITPAARVSWQKANNRLASQPETISFNRVDLLPSLNISYKQLYLSYDKNVLLPQYNYLIPVSDNTNPYYITKGNAALAPAKRNNFSLNYYFNNPKKSLNIGGYISYGTINNDVIQSISVNSQGVQTTVPVNADGTRSFSSNYNINKQYKNKQSFIFSWYTGAYYGYNRSRLLFNDESSWQSTTELNQWMGFALNWNDKVEWNNGYSIRYNFTGYTSPKFTRLEILNHNLNTELIVRYPKHVIWESQYTYSYNSRITGASKSAMLWNAALNFTMLKDERGVLRLSVFDILGQSRTLSVNASRNMITRYQTNILPRYFAGTFTYNFRPTGAVKRKVGGERLLMF